jgi:hypothetical protein
MRTKKENFKVGRYDLVFAYSLMGATTYIGALGTMWGGSLTRKKI